MSTLSKLVRKESNNFKLTPKKEIGSLTSNLNSTASKKQMKVPSDKIKSNNTRNAHSGNKNIFEIENREIIDDLLQDTNRISGNYKGGKSVGMTSQLSPPQLLAQQMQENSYFSTSILSELIDKLNQDVQCYANKIKSEIENQKLFLKKDKLDYNMRIKEYNSLNETINKEEESIYSKIKYLDKLKVREKVGYTAMTDLSIRSFKLVFTEKFKILAQPEQYLSLIRQLFIIFFNSKLDELELSVNNESFVSSKDKNGYSLENLAYLCNNIKNSTDISSLFNYQKENVESNYKDLTLLISKLKNKSIKDTLPPVLDFSHILEMMEMCIEREYVLKEIILMQEEMVILVNKKDKIFLILKELESHILVNDNNFKNNTKLLKMVTAISEKAKALSDTKKTQPKDQFSAYNEIRFAFDEISKSEIIKVQKKPVNFYSLTLKSEYSDEQDRNHTDRYGAGSFVVQDEVRKHSGVVGAPINPKQNSSQLQGMKIDIINNRSPQPLTKTKSLINNANSKFEGEEVANIKMTHNKIPSAKKIDGGRRELNLALDENILNNSVRSKGGKHISKIIPKSAVSAINATTTNKTTVASKNETQAKKIETQKTIDSEKKPVKSSKIIESNSGKNYFPIDNQYEDKDQRPNITSSIININNNNNYFIIEKDIESPIIHGIITNHINSTISKSLIQSYKETLSTEKPKIKLNLNNSDLMEPIKSDFQNFHKFKSEHNSQKEESVSVYGNNHSIDVNLMNFEKDCCNSNDLFTSTSN